MNKQISASGLMDELSQARTKKKEFWEQMERLNMGAAKAGAKGINESLVIVDSLAFIVNVPNQTVITAMDQTETSANVFTNIDGAVIM